MPTHAARAATESRLAFHEVLSDDGTRLAAWTNDPDGVMTGPTVVLCNGLGTNAWSWPALLRPECDVRVVSWNHRGTGGSDRPADGSHCGIDAFVEDALSVMDAFNVGKAVLMGWSMGVNTMFELAYHHPERVSGLFAVAGVPGDTFATMLGPLRLPRIVTKTVTTSLARTLQVAGRAITPISTRLPVGTRAISVLTRTGFMFPVPDPELAAVAVREFLTTPIEWYMRLALATAEHGRVSLSGLGVPVAFVAGSWDILSGTRDMQTAAARIPDATYEELRGSHFIQMEQPDRVHQLLLEFLERVG